MTKLNFANTLITENLMDIHFPQLGQRVPSSFGGDKVIHHLHWFPLQPLGLHQ